jgi:transposase
MSNAELTDAHWQKIYAFLLLQEAIRLGEETACRRFVEAVLWVLRSGAQWRLLPAQRGRWNSVYRRFRRWGRHRIWEKMFDFFCHDEDLKKLIGDSTVVRAHACAAGAPAPGQALPFHQELGRSRGGFSTKIHFLISGNEQPQRVILTPGQAGDAPQVPHLFDQLSPNFGILDKAYDSDKVLEYFENHDITPVIPPKANRVVQREYDKELYKERNLIERFIGKIKQFRRVFSRFEKYARTYLHFIHFACALISLR